MTRRTPQSTDTARKGRMEARKGGGGGRTAATSHGDGGGGYGLVGCVVLCYGVRSVFVLVAECVDAADCGSFGSWKVDSVGRTGELVAKDCLHSTQLTPAPNPPPNAVTALRLVGVPINNITTANTRHISHRLHSLLPAGVVSCCAD
jgi:hypothetical protein